MFLRRHKIPIFHGFLILFIPFLAFWLLQEIILQVKRYSGRTPFESPSILLHQANKAELFQKVSFRLNPPLACNTPTFSPWDSAVKPFIRNLNATSFTCARKPPLIQRLNSTHLAVDLEVAVEYYAVRNVSTLFCVACEIVRVEPKNFPKNPDNHYRLSRNCSNMKHTQEIPFEFTYVKCYKKSKKRIYRNVYVSFPLKKKLLKSERSSWTHQKDQLSVLFIGIDTVSKYHFHRLFNSTAKFISDNGFIHLNKFMKIGENTLPNIITSMTGYFFRKQPCWKGYKHVFDDCEFIWKKFENSNYVTGYFEDRVMKTTFNHLRPGFSNQPVDYYYRPAFLAMDKLLSVEKHRKFKKIKCVGDRFDAEIVIDAAKNFASSFQNTPYFGLFWTNDFTHDRLSLGYVADNFYKELFEYLFSTEDILNKTIVFFVSDHGMNFGKFRETYMGWLEERMPFYTIWLPLWFKEKYVTATENLLSNADRITSPFDTYKTLVDILNNDFSGSSASSDFSKLGISLFRPIPKDRTCNDAGIPPEFCTCTGSEEISVDFKTVKKAVKVAMVFITNTIDFRICHRLKIHKIISARLFDRKNISYRDYLVTFRSFPGDAIFQATLRENHVTKNLTILGHVSRLNSYGNTSFCVTDPIERLYCYCNNG